MRLRGGEDGVTLELVEPSTMATDFVLALVCFVLGFRLRRRAAETGQRSTGFWCGAFFVTGVAALTGGLVHGLGDQFPASPYLWRTTLRLLGLMSLLVALGSVSATLAPKVRKFVVPVLVIKFTAFVFATSMTENFSVVVIDYVPAMIFVAVLHLWRRNSRQNDADKWIPAGVAVSLAGAAIQQTGLGFGTHFNHNDVYHVIQTAGMCLFYAGATRLSDRP